MAANSFATMLHKSSPKMGVILVYTLLEWVLIGLLLLNALFSYLISRFANYFGLKPPCLLCSRVDHLFEPGGTPRKSYTDLLCNDHVAEISRLGFCSRHQRVPEGNGGFCSECCSECGSESSHAIEEELKCCCCGAPLDQESEISDDSVRRNEACGDPAYSQITVTFQDEEGGHQETGDRAVIIILDEDVDDSQNHDEAKGDTMVVDRQGEADADAGGEREADPESSDVVSLAPSQSSEQYRRVYGADFYVKLLSHCRECGTILEENLVSEELLDQNIVGSKNLHWSEAREEDGLPPNKDDMPVPNVVTEAAPCQKEAVDFSYVFFPTKENDDATMDCSLVTTADIFDNQVLHCQKGFSPDEAHSISTDRTATKEDTMVGEEIHIAAASEVFDQIAYEAELKRVSVSDGISEQKPLQVTHSLDCLIQSTGICIYSEDKGQDTEEDDKTDGDLSIATIATEEHIYSIQNPELLQPLLDHIKPAEVYSDNDEKVTGSDDNGKTDSERSCEVSIGSEICEQEQSVPLQIEESHSSLADQEEIELKHAIGEGHEGTERNGQIVDVQEGSVKEICNQEQSYSPIQDIFSPLSAQLILSTGSLPEQAAVSEECSRNDIREVSEMVVDHHCCDCELTLSSNASVLASDVIEAQEHTEICQSQIQDGCPPLDIQISQSADSINGDLITKSGDPITYEVNDHVEIAKAVTEGDSRILSSNDIQNKEVECTVTIPEDLLQNPLDAESTHILSFQFGQSTGLNSRMEEENQENVNIRIETSQDTSAGDHLNDEQMVDSCKDPEGSKEAAEEIPSQEGYSQIKVESSAKHIDTLRTTDHIGNHQEHTQAEDNEMEEEKAPETPNSEEGIQNLHTRLVFDRKDHATESVDGSVASEIDGSEPVTLEYLKAALKAERNALRSLYAELEEERSASAIAANQTMAMITRLQEEKASMQMEALQYQRMMEEQTEYDQEALQMLNELVMKREKEKLELEKELEMYQKKLEHYEARKRRKSGNTNGQNGLDTGMSDGDDSDGHSSDSNEEQNIYGVNKKHKTSADVKIHSAIDEETLKNLISLDESLDDFEEERISILTQLKELEEKFYILDDEAVSSQKRKHGDEFADEHMDTLDEIDETQNSVAGDCSSGFSDELVSDEKESRRKHLLTGGKRLLPLFDAAASDNIEGSQLEFTDVSSESVSRSDTKIDKIAIAEEVDLVYDRLSALEADREFLKNCIRSLKNGDKGIKLLQEILQHLHDLKHAELQPRNSDAATAPSG